MFHHPKGKLRLFGKCNHCGKPSHHETCGKCDEKALVPILARTPTTVLV